MRSKCWPDFRHQYLVPYNPTGVFKYLLAYSLAIAGHVLSGQIGTSEHQVSITSSKFVLFGTTNLSDFRCELVQKAPATAIPVKSNKSEYQIKFKGLEMRYPLEDFDCGLEAMSQDLRKTLRSDTYPYLYLRINDIRIKQDEAQEIEKLTVVSSVTITIAGVSHSTVIEDGLVINHSEDALTLTGNQLVNMNDFNIEPPSKFFGMVRVNSELSVSFELNMEVKTLK